MKKDAPRSAGNGRDCISHPVHGASTVLPTGREWCPHQTHDGKPGVKDSASTPWLDRQTDGTQAVEAEAS